MNLLDIIAVCVLTGSISFIAGMLLGIVRGERTGRERGRLEGYYQGVGRKMRRDYPNLNKQYPDAIKEHYHEP